MAGTVVITGGGTGGHVFPMRAVADALRESGVNDDDLRFVGSRRGQERDLLADDRVRLTLLPGRGLRRSWRARDVWANALAVGGLLGATALSMFLVRRWRASVVVSVGGYASVATTLAAVCWRVPVVLVESDATAGAAQRLVARVAAARCCAFGAEGENVVVTGAPIRKEVEAVDRSEHARSLAKRRIEPPIDEDRAVVVVMTGSLGSSRVNGAVSELASLWSSRRDRTIIHVTGRRDYDDVLSRRPRVDGLDYRILAFADMTELWGLCDIAVCRAGAITIAELTALAIPSILVPLPGAPYDHQTRNAVAVADAGGAIVVRDANCTGAELAEQLDDALDSARNIEMARRAGAQGRRNAAGAIAAVVLGIRGRA